jgi:signal transduction histidine kinase
MRRVEEARERLAAILASIVDRLVIVDRDLRVVWMNETAATAMGRVSGQFCYEVTGAAPETCAGCPAVRTLRSGKVEHGVRSELSASGRMIHLDLVTAPLCDASGAVHQVIEVSRDITELVEMEERLKQTNQALLAAQSQLIEKERLAAIGQLVVGLHHTILNPLTGILGALQVLKQGDLEPSQGRAALDAAEEEVRKIELLVKRLPHLHRTDELPYVGRTTMLDLERSCEAGTPPGGDRR